MKRAETKTIARTNQIIRKCGTCANQTHRFPIIFSIKYGYYKMVMKMSPSPEPTYLKKYNMSADPKNALLSYSQDMCIYFLFIFLIIRTQCYEY